MNKKTILIGAAAGGIIGSYIPTFFGDKNLLSGWSILGGMIGGFVGILVAAWISKRYEL